MCPALPLVNTMTREAYNASRAVPLAPYWWLWWLRIADCGWNTRNADCGVWIAELRLRFHNNRTRCTKAHVLVNNEERRTTWQVRRTRRIKQERRGGGGKKNTRKAYTQDMGRARKDSGLRAADAERRRTRVADAKDGTATYTASSLRRQPHHHHTATNN